MWPKLASYLLREISGLYIVGVAAFCLLLSIDLLSVLARQLIDYNAPVVSVAKLLILKFPWFLHLSLPIAAVFAVLLATGRLAKDSELKASYALGVKPLRLFFPILVFGLFATGLGLVNNGYLEPNAEKAFYKEFYNFRQERPPVEIQEDAAYAIDGEGVFYAGRMRADQNDLQRADLQGVLIMRDDGVRISASMGEWVSAEKIWRLYDARIIDNEGIRTTVEEYVTAFDIDSDIQASLANEENLDLTGLWTRWREAVAAGENSRDLAFEFHRKVADAFSAFVFVLAAAALGLHLKGRSMGFAWTIVLIVIFYFLWTLSGDMFEQQVLSASVAAWATIVIVAIIGSALAWIRLR